MNPILYSYFRSSASYRVRIALHLKKINFDYQSIHLMKDGGQQHALNYRSINPMGQVPLFVDGHALIAQSMAIIQYIDEKWATPKLFPKDLEKRAYVTELCEIINSGIQPLQNLNTLQMLEKKFSADQATKDEWSKHYITEGLKAFEKRISKDSGKYCLGDEISAADCFLVPQVYNAFRFGADINNFPIVKKINENLVTIEAFKKAHPDNQPDSPKEN